MFEVSNLDKNSNSEPMLDMFIFETEQLTEQLEQIILRTEKSKSFDFDDINEIFRIMHTIKGSSAMMLFNNISTLAHSIEDVFYFLREKKEAQFDKKIVIDLILESVDFIKTELSKISSGYSSEGDSSNIIEKIRDCLKEIKENNDCPSELVTEKDDKNQKYYIGSYKLQGIKTEKSYDIFILFEEGCGMENIQAFSIIHSLKEHAFISSFYPPDIMDDDSSPEYIKNNGFRVSIKTTLSNQELHDELMRSVFVKELEIHELEEQPQRHNKEIILDEEEKAKPVKPDVVVKDSDSKSNQLKQSFISVSLQKLDKLLDLVGELVISESMVTRNPEIEKLEIESFNKASRQLRKISSELQDMVMSIRMVPVASTFQKMNRIVRDMSNKLSKEVSLEIIGEETEVDKNIIETISDPLMHIIRNSLDHGIESPQERAENGKERTGKIVLEAGNLGGDIFVSVSDDGRGLDRSRILEKAKKQGLLTKPENELSDKEINSFIFMPGFSTKESVSEFSGRGVGMDVVMKNIKKINGNITVESVKGKGTSILIKIPLTLAIINGMVIRVGDSSFIVPTTSIRESFEANENDVFCDPDGNEMILIRGTCYNVLRLHRLFGTKGAKQNIEDGIIIMVENDEEGICIFSDELVGEQQVVVKSLPGYVKKVNGISGCTLLGDGSISLILDTEALIKNKKER